MRQVKLWILISAISSLIVVGCGVKEDRSECPCRLKLDMTHMQMDSGDSLLLMIDTESSRIYSEYIGSDSLSKDYVVDVPRVSLGLMAWCGGEGMIGREGLVIPVGRSCPRVYTYVSQVNADAESVCDTLIMRKNHCVLSIGFKYASSNDFKLTVKGNICGYDERGILLEGEFIASAVRMDSIEQDISQIILPRQNGGELYLIVDGGDELVKTFPLSDYISATGYDWTRPDLEDIRLIIDIVSTNVCLSVSGWDEEFFFDVVI